MAVCLLALGCPASGARAMRRAATATADKPITAVVKMLEAMLKKSKEEGDEEKKLFAKHKCYCDDEEAAKTQKIEDKTSEIEVLASKIAEIQASTALASQAAAKIKARIEDIKLEQAKLTKIRDDENTEFLAFKADSEEAIGQAKNAIEELSSVGADQTEFGAAADNTQYMAGFSGAQVSMKTSLKVSLKKAMSMALATGKKEAAAKLGAFLELKGFTGTYAAQSGEVVGILKNMRDTMEAELATATEAEKKALETFNKVMGALDEEVLLLEADALKEQGILSSNDGDLSTKTQEKADAEAELADAQQFLESLLDICKTKAEEYSKRVELRTGEETAIAEAIAILNSDAAFEAFGKTDSTAFVQAPPALVQILNNRKGALRSGDQARSNQALSLLRKVAVDTKSLMMARIASLLEADNPFTTVLAAIDEMLKTITDEADLDKEKETWCFDERKQKNSDLADSEAQISTLEGEIQVLVTAIGDPLTGLKVQIKATEDSLTENVASQTSETGQRTEENLAYQKNIEELVEVKDLITKALTVLKAYYEEAMKTDGTGFIQTKKEDPKPPSTWTTYDGQSSQGNSAIGMLEFILSNAKAEETEAHKAESQAQELYEKSMTDLKALEAADQKLLADLQGELAEKEKELLDKNKDLKATEEVKASIEAYLLKIKPGCDFIVQNIALRDRARDEETTALVGAKRLIEDTPVYKEAVMAATNETLGDCADICHNNDDHVDCKACVAKTSVPGYCAGHPLTTGC